MAMDYKSTLSLDTRQHDNAIKKSADEVKKYGDKTQKASQDVRELIKQQREAKKQYEANQKALREYGLAYSDFKNQITSTIKGYIGFAAAAGAVTSALKYNIETAAKFSTSLSQLSSLTGLRGDDLNYLKDAAIKLGSTTTQSASEVVDAFKLIGSQKPELLKSKEALVQVTKAAITLSEASGMKMEDAAKALTMSLNQMGASAGSANKYINILAAGSKEGAADISYLTTAIEKTGSMANSSKIPFNQLIAIIESVAPKFSSADVAGSQLNSTLLKLSTQTNNNFKPSVVGYKKAIENLAKAEMDDVQLKQLVGESNMSMIKALIEARGEQERLTKAITDTNTAEEQAKTNTDNFEGSVKNLQSAWEGLNLAINASNGFLKTTVDQLTKVLGVWSNLVKLGWTQGKAVNIATNTQQNGDENTKFSNAWVDRFIKGDGTLQYLQTEAALENRRKQMIDELYNTKKGINTNGWSDTEKRALDKMYIDAIDAVNEYIQQRKDEVNDIKKESDAITSATQATTSSTTTTKNTTKKLTDLEKAIISFKDSLKKAKARTNSLNVFSGLTEMSNVDYYTEQLNIVSQELNAYKQKLEDVGDLTDEEKKRVIELNNERKRLTQKIKKEQEIQRYKDDYERRTNPDNITNALFGNGKPAEEILKTSIEEIAKNFFSDSSKARLYIGDLIYNGDDTTPEIKQKTLAFFSPKRSWEGWQQTPTFEDASTWNFDTNSQAFKQYSEEWVKWYQSLLKFESDIEDEIRNFIEGKKRVEQLTPEQAKELSSRLFNVEDILFYIEDNPDLKEIGKIIVNAILNKEFIRGEIDKANSSPRFQKIKGQLFGNYQSGLNDQIESVKKQQEQIKIEQFRVPQDITDSVISYGNAWKSYFELMNSEDADAWDGFSGMIEVLQSSIDMVMNLINQMEKYSELSKQFVAAKQAETALSKQSAAAKAAETGAEIGLTAAESGEAIAGATSSGAKLPFPYNIAAIAAGVAAVLSALAAVSSFKDGGIIPKFADGGVFQGHSSLGDMNLARVNGGEMIINGSQQEKLFRMLNSNGGYSNTNNEGNVTFRIEGSQLVGVLQNYNKRMGKII